jgi:hypothetical protein
MDRPGIGARLSVVLTRWVTSLHKSLCACADYPPKVGGPSACAKQEISLGRDCVFLDDCTTDCPRF